VKLSLLAIVLTVFGASLWARPPSLPKNISAATLDFSRQAELPNLEKAYISSSPQDLNDGLKVGRLDVPGTVKAIEALRMADTKGQFANLDSILLWKDGKLIFEMYARRGRVDAPHYAMSITKTLTSMALARAIQLGHLQLNDLDRPVLDFMPNINRQKIKPGVETITLSDALMMKSGLRFKDRLTEHRLALEYNGQEYFQKLFENTAAVTPQSKKYKYGGVDPLLVMMVISQKVPGRVQDFIHKELIANVRGDVYLWNKHGSGLPKAGAGSSFTSRALVKLGVTVLQGGKFNGRQLLDPDYVKRIMDRQKGEGYFYFFHNRRMRSEEINFISGIGAGGQLMSIFPKLNVVAVVTSHNKKGQNGKPLEAIMSHLIPLFEK
jgi:CubicO group peptidase (beta-lactamase class C family)